MSKVLANTLGTRRRQFFVLTGLSVFLLFVFSRKRVHQYVYTPKVAWYSGGKLTDAPPAYDKLYEWERELPQHDLALPYPEGSLGRYVKFSNQIKALGWNNVFNEILLCTHLAYQSKRAYVFQDYVWKPEYFPWRIPVMEGEGGPYWPHTPLNAIISGPTAGGAWDANDTAPRSVSEAWFDQVCPESERRIITTDSIKPALREAQGSEILARWTEVLLEAPERCVEIIAGPSSDDSFPQTFDLWLIGSDRIVSLWDNFSVSPTSRLLGTSPLVNSAVDRNEYLFNPRGPRPAHPASRIPYDRMMALHIRRGDYKEACVGLATWNSTFYGWNLLPFLPDGFTPPPGGSWGYNTPENTEKYMEHCWPTFEAMVEKIRDSRSAYIANGIDRTLDVMFLLTNAEKEWLDQMKAVLKADGWHTIVTSKDLVLDQEQIGVNMAIDMDIARRAAVFIGNGWSSFTSNIIHRRLVDGNEPISNRFW